MIIDTDLGLGVPGHDYLLWWDGLGVYVDADYDGPDGKLWVNDQFLAAWDNSIHPDEASAFLAYDMQLDAIDNHIQEHIEYLRDRFREP